MKSAKAPAGYYTYAHIRILLETGVNHTYHWDTPMGLAQAGSKTLSWAKAEMRTEKVRGRSKIRAFTISVELRPGEFKKS